MKQPAASNTSPASQEDGEFNASRRQFVSQLSLATATALLASAVPSARASEGPPVPTTPLPSSFQLAPQPPLTPGPHGLDIRTWVRSSQTAGRYSCVESAVAPRHMGPAPHLHKELDELMYVLEGTATVWMDGHAQEIPAGGWHFRPRQIPHTFWNGGETPLRFLDMYFTQNFEDFLEERFHQIIPDMVKNHLSPKDPGIARRMDDLNRRFGVVMFPEKRQPLVERYGLIG